jgi:hypothetical protein
MELVVCIAGCVTETPHGSGSVYRFETWIPLEGALVSIIGVVAGLLLLKFNSR